MWIVTLSDNSIIEAKSRYDRQNRAGEKRHLHERGWCGLNGCEYATRTTVSARFLNKNNNELQFRIEVNTKSVLRKIILNVLVTKKTI